MDSSGWFQGIIAGSMLVNIGFSGTVAQRKSGTLWHVDGIEAEAAFVGSVQACGFPAAGYDSMLAR